MTYVISESIGNFATEVFRSENFYEVQDYLQQRFEQSGQTDEQLFYSYFHIAEEP